MAGATQRLDAFTDAAFAFALTVFVAGGSGAAIDAAALRATISAVPAFAIGFAIIAMFWFTHVRWRSLRGDGDWRSVLLTLALVFAVLSFVQPLRAMAISFADFLAQRKAAGGSATIGEVFAAYGVGFVAMSLIVVGLWGDALRRATLDPQTRNSVRGEIAIWSILVATGMVSVALAWSNRLQFLAPLAYATLPMTIGGFAWWWYGRHGGDAHKEENQ